QATQLDAPDRSEVVDELLPFGRLVDRRVAHTCSCLRPGRYSLAHRVTRRCRPCDRVRRHRAGGSCTAVGVQARLRPVQEQRLRPTEPLDLALTLGPLQRGRYDPCTRVTSREVWRATRTPDG